jgi:putative DNA-invertase from lambdoid prophage Rac
MASKVVTLRPKENARGTKPRRVFAYLRVSTDTQDLDSQKVGIVDYAKSHSLVINEWFEETASGALDSGRRVLGQKLMPLLLPEDALIVPELSRLGRSTADILATLKFLTERRVTVHIVKGAFQLSDNINSKILATVLGLAAEIERDLICQRTREGLARARASGKHIGRPRIERDEDRRSKLDKHAEEIRKLAAGGVSKAAMSRLLNCNSLTVDLWLTRHRVKIQKGAT